MTAYRHHQLSECEDQETCPVHPAERTGFQMPQTREEYDQMKARLEAGGFTVITKWRKGLKQIRLGDIVLSGARADSETSDG